MKFSECRLLLLEKREVVSKKSGKPCTFVTLVNEATYERDDFFLSRDTDFAGLIENSEYNVVPECRDKFWSVRLTPVNA